MRAIRAARSITQEAVVRATKAPPNVVKEFETTSLVGNPMYNRVYLRLFVRAYAEVVGIRATDALKAIEDVLSGTYTGRMAQLYLDESATSEERSANAGGEETAPPAAAQSAPGLVSGRADQELFVKTSADSLGPASDNPKSAVADDSTRKPPAPEASPVVPPAAEPASAKVGTAKPTSSNRRGPAFLMPDSASTLRAVGAVLGVVAILVTAWLLWPTFKAAEPASVVASLDTLHAPVPVLSPRVVLADTVVYSVIAARDTLNPFIVNAEEAFLDGRWVSLTRASPIWVQFRDTLHVRVTDVFEIQRHTDDVDVLLQGQPVPLELIRRDLRISFSRGEAQAYLDSLRTAAGPPGA
jgi:Helix-turn-helix domain